MGNGLLTRAPDYGLLTTHALIPSRLSDRRALTIFARAPTPGKAKTRLIPVLGARGAARFHEALISDSIRKVNALRERVTRYLFLTGRAPASSSGLRRYTLARQRGRNLGERLERAFRRLLHRHTRAVVMGTDSPALRPRLLREAFRELEICDAVLGPCPDGGYYLIGLRRKSVRIDSGLFRGIRWGTRFAFRDTRRNLLARGFSCSILEPVGDVDRPEDLRRLRRELARKSALRRLAPRSWAFLKSWVEEVRRGDS